MLIKATWEPEHGQRSGWTSRALATHKGKKNDDACDTLALVKKNKWLRPAPCDLSKLHCIEIHVLS